MRNEKGFTRSEILVTIVIVFVVGLILLAAFKTLNRNSYCETFRNATVTDTPKECIEYLLGSN